MLCIQQLNISRAVLRVICGDVLDEVYVIHHRSLGFVSLLILTNKGGYFSPTIFGLNVCPLITKIVGFKITFFQDLFL